MMRIDLAEHLSDGVRADVRAALAAMRGRPVRVRLVNVPAEAFQAAVDRALRVLGPVPFAPTVGGVPCQPGIEAHPVVICVADDDTNITRDAAREIDAWRPSFLAS